MADPVKETKKHATELEVKAEVPETPLPPVHPGSSPAELAGYNQMIKITAAKKGAPTSVIPGGIKIDATPFIRTRTNPRDVRVMLGDGGSIVGEAFKREHSGWQYEWPIEKSEDTQAFIRAGRYKKVPFSAIDGRNPNAMVTESPTGDTIWKQHILVAVSPQVYFEDHIHAEHEAIRQNAMNRAALENELTNAFGKAGFRGQVEITDVRQER